MTKGQHQGIKLWKSIEDKNSIKNDRKNDGYHVEQRGFRKIWSREQIIRSTTEYTNLYKRVQKLINYNSSL